MKAKKRTLARHKTRHKKGRLRRLFLWTVFGVSLFYGLQTQEGIFLKQRVTQEAVRIWPIYQNYWGPYLSWANEQKTQFLTRVHTAHQLVVGDESANRLHFIFKPKTRNVA